MWQADEFINKARPLQADDGPSARQAIQDGTISFYNLTDTRLSRVFMLCVLLDTSE